MVPRYFSRIAIVTGVLPTRDSEIRGAIVRMAKSNTILKPPVRREKIKLNFYFHTSLLGLKRFYEGLQGLQTF